MKPPKKKVGWAGIVNFAKSNACRRNNSSCYRHRELVLRMAKEMASLSEIARKIGTNTRLVRGFLDREGIKRKYPTNYGGPRSPCWRGGRHVDKNGAIYILSPDHPHKTHAGYVFEHRLIMEKMIGRYLIPNEVVHHRDGNPGNNSPDNLQLFSENAEHLAYELKGRVPNWSKEGISRMKEGIARSSILRRERKRLGLAPDGSPLL